MKNKESWFPKFKPYQGDLDQQPVQVDEYLPVGKSIILGLQHAFAMFGATVLAPLLMGFDPNLTILITGIGTILFFLMTGGRMPSYLGSSFAFIGAIAAVTGYAGVGANPNIGLALGGTIACGLVYAAIGLIVIKTGTGWIEKLMPPIVTGAIVMIIGLNLAPGAIKSVSGNPFDMWMAVLTILCISFVAVFTRGMVRRLLLLIGLCSAYLLYFILANILGFSNYWYEQAITHKVRYCLPNKLEINILESPYFLATKFEAYKGRGNNDPLMSKDIEDILTVCMGRSTLVEEIYSSPQELKDYLSHVLAELQNHNEFQIVLDDQCRYGSKERVKQVINAIIKQWNKAF